MRSSLVSVYGPIWLIQQLVREKIVSLEYYEEEEEDDYDDEDD